MRKNISVPEKLYNKAAELAARDQVSVDEFVSKVLFNQFAVATLSKLEPGFSRESNSSGLWTRFPV